MPVHGESSNFGDLVIEYSVKFDSEYTKEQLKCWVFKKCGKNSSQLLNYEFNRIILIHNYLRYSITSALSYSPSIPANAIWFPGTYFPGAFKYINKCFSVQVIFDFFIAFEYLNPVDPANLPTIPPIGGAEAPFTSLLQS